MKRTLLVPVLLSPWLLAVWVGFHNLRQPPRHLQLLTETTPPLPIGGWLLLSSSLGVTLGAATVGVLLQTKPSPRRRRWQETGPEPPPMGMRRRMGRQGKNPAIPGHGTGEAPNPARRSRPPSWTCRSGWCGRRGGPPIPPPRPPPLLPTTLPPPTGTTIGNRHSPRLGEQAGAGPIQRYPG